MAETGKEGEPPFNDGSAPQNDPIENQSNNTEQNKEDAPKNGLKVDAIASDGVLSLLNAPASSEERARSARSLSFGSKSEIKAQVMQTRFQANRVALQQYLATLENYLDKIRDLNRHTQLRVPENGGLQVLKVDVKLGSSSIGVAGHAPDVVEQRLLQVLKHIQRLQLRLADSRSRVLVTGDLNAGKSSLCNKLLRRRVLPVDQQPCTDVFCEVIDASKNRGIEEVHAIKHPQDATQVKLGGNNGSSSSSSVEALDANDDPTLVDKFPLADLKDLVHQPEKYRLLIVYVKDRRAQQESLLSNGIVDICLIDAPGLNVSEVTTTELFGRQEEIDLVIFVVSAENHFTQSAREFVSDAAREKSLLFIAVNNFDRIRDKERCRTKVLDQIAELAPETRKGSSDFVHFGAYSDNGDPDEDPNDPNNNNDDDDQNNDADALEASLRNFILEKRSSSKLAPARTYVLNVLSDLKVLCHDNRTSAEHELRELNQQLDSLMPEIDNSVSEYASVSEKIEKDTERLVLKLQSETEEQLNKVVSEIGEQPPLEWTGLANTFQYANDTRDALVQRVLSSVEVCEDYARESTASAVSAIKQLGILHVGEKPAFSKIFNKSAMFSRKRDNLSKHIQAEFGLGDLLDIGYLLERPLPVLQSSKAALLSSQSNPTGLTITAVSLIASSLVPITSALAPFAPVIRVIKELDIKRLYIPALALVSLAIGAYTIHELPRTIPRRLARKIAFELDEMGYVRSNASRIGAEARKVLRYPAQDVRSAFQSQLESRTRRREEYEKHLSQAEYMLKALTEIEEGSSQDLQAVKQMTL